MGLIMSPYYSIQSLRVFWRWYFFTNYLTARAPHRDTQGSDIGKFDVLVDMREFKRCRDFSVTTLVTSKEGDINIGSSGTGIF